MRLRLERRRARKIDDRAALARDHLLADQDREPERPLEVHVQDLVEQRLGRFGQRRRERRHAGIVHQNIYAPKMAVGRLGETIIVLPVADMRRDRQRPAAELLDLARDLLAGLKLAAGDDDIRARLRKRQHHLAPEPARASCDERDFVREIDLHARLRVIKAAAYRRRARYQILTVIPGRATRSVARGRGPRWCS